MKAKFIFLFLLIGLVLLSVLPKGVGKYNTFAQCLTDNGAVMYGTEWCIHCKNQKALFGASFEVVNYVDCDLDRNACSSAGISGYPTWVIGGNLYPGEQSLSQLATLTECELVEDDPATGE
ncbi:MAG: hypothetical protein GOV00_01805 [Candidatus Altiarchaeota archaeon]|nr:hypothetical protein [Candidatus Altiarchaeota archaeon]